MSDSLLTELNYLFLISKLLLNNFFYYFGSAIVYL